MEIKMAEIPGGDFTMGSPDDEPARKGDETRYTVTLNSFYMGKYPVTQEQFEEVMGYNPSRFKRADPPLLFFLLPFLYNPGDFEGANRPVEMVTWYEAAAFCNRLSELDGIEKVYTLTEIECDDHNMATANWSKSGYRRSREGLEPVYTMTDIKDDDITKVTVITDWNKNGYRLPTEAEWEYACRAGTTTPFNTGKNITTDQANYNGKHPYNGGARGEYRKKTTPVDSFAPNAWGLYDMHGNVWEWCWDWYQGDGLRDCRGLRYGHGDFCVIRGGSWSNYGRHLRSACWSDASPRYRSEGIGFRVARNL